MGTTAALVVLSIAAPGCRALQPSTLVSPAEPADRVEAAFGQSPTHREMLGREGNQIDDVEDTVLMTWIAPDLGEDPGAFLRSVVRGTGSQVVYEADYVPERDPRDPNDIEELRGCVPGTDGRRGIDVSYGPSREAEGSYVVVIEVGGPPAASPCS
jgi:hypothetical protein